MFAAHFRMRFRSRSRAIYSSIPPCAGATCTNRRSRRWRAAASSAVDLRCRDGPDRCRGRR